MPSNLPRDDMDFTGHKHSRATGHRRAVAPVPFGLALLGVWALLLLGGGVAAAIDAVWWLGIALLLPGVGLHVWLGRKSARTIGVSGESSGASDLLISAAAGVGAAQLARAVGARYFPLALVLAVILVIEPLARLQWRLRNPS